MSRLRLVSQGYLGAEKPPASEGVRVGGPAKWFFAYLVLGAGAAWADGTAWLPEPQTGYLTASVVHQSADEFYEAAARRPTPGGENLSQATAWLNAEYAPADGWSVDVQAGWARSRFTTGPGIPTDSDRFSGIVDASVGITRRLTDEAHGALPSMAVRVAAIAAGDYRTGRINSLGDGGSGYEVSVIAGRFFGPSVGLSAELGYRNRDKGIPSENFAYVSGLWLVNSTVTLGVDYRVVHSRSGLDIGGPGFSPDRFPQLGEESETLGARLFVNFGGNGFSVFHARVLDGRNTAASGIWGVSMSRYFDFFAP